MLTAHRKRPSVIAVYARDIAETKATEAMELAKSKAIRSRSVPSRRNDFFVMPGQSPSKTGVNALIAGHPRLPFCNKDVDGRDRPGHDG
jgi:hypothetical protein